MSAFVIGLLLTVFTPVLCILLLKVSALSVFFSKALPHDGVDDFNME